MQIAIKYACPAANKEYSDAIFLLSNEGMHAAA
jgi:hypothetical protein